MSYRDEDLPALKAHLRVLEEELARLRRTEPELVGEQEYCPACNLAWYVACERGHRWSSAKPTGTCPKCNTAYMPTTRIATIAEACPGGWYQRIFRGCPRGLHLHQRCDRCGAAWVARPKARGAP